MGHTNQNYTCGSIIYSAIYVNDIPTNEKRIKKPAPISTALRLATFVMSIVCTFSVKVVDPVPEPQSPARKLQKPSNPMPLLTIPRVGGIELTFMDAE